VNPLHRGLGRNGGVEDPNLEHAEITPSDDEHEQEEANPKKKMRGSPKPDDQPAHEDECMDEIFNMWKHEEEVTLPDLETVFLNDTVLKEMVVRCGDEKGRLVPEDGCEKNVLSDHRRRRERRENHPLRGRHHHDRHWQMGECDPGSDWTKKARKKGNDTDHQTNGRRTH